ncbi:bifunctional methyltransferase/pyrophosphohydrolase YabN [Tepidimicrobium xylanilyticum]|uniref:Tetrapyrrole methylase family protein / MazG family protein n=1 Tax=Tepidimicrobium xylanilyticum TaxID=1123352 RepID=A0A1H2XQR1_9FIRM|nr:nucleoside triphosphate pyrophosphohydrolase [Tepidimicrobium xylanilyticum]GMG97563.1 MazG family protein [Tepidimicrobium xylanilyticum]SDW95116.1 tetrapyrrole methylase family protein / MazG family protein [Tepidimicrobium xylanilyticum]
MGKIHILGLGPGDIDYLTIGVINRINSGDRNFLRTAKHPAIRYFKENNIPYESYDYVYDIKEDFTRVYEYIVDDLITKARNYKSINYIVPGNPMVAEKTVELLFKSEDKDIDIELLTGVSFIEPILELVKKDPVNGLKIVDGADFDINNIDINIDYIITQVYNRRVASNVKLVLSEVYGDEYEIYVVNRAGVKGEEKLYKIPIYELDRIDDIDSLTSIYIPKVDKIIKKLYDVADIIGTMKRLRSEKGCPWDRKQTHETIRQSIIEEAYEVVDAIDRKDEEGLIEELGDLLFQIVFHCQIASEEGRFNLYHITTKLNDKLIYRHPHVFGEKKVENSDEVVYNWNKLKYRQKGISTFTDTLKDIPHLPALMKSYKVQERAGQMGFDWDSVDGALSKVKEEYLEVMELINNIEGGDVEEIEEELGDLLFAVVNVCRFLNVNPEIALNKTVNKFIRRFEIMENESRKMGKKLEEMTLEEMDRLWDKAKLHKF